MSDEPLVTTDLTCMVEFGLDPVAMHGRPGYYSGVRPHHQMPGREYNFIGQLDYLDRELLRPGEVCRAKGSFIVAEQDLDRFRPGFSWLVVEGSKVVGHCRILEIL